MDNTVLSDIKYSQQETRFIFGSQCGFGALFFLLFYILIIVVQVKTNLFMIFFAAVITYMYFIGYSHEEWIFKFGMKSVAVHTYFFKWKWRTKYLPISAVGNFEIRPLKRTLYWESVRHLELIYSDNTIEITVMISQDEDKIKSLCRILESAKQRL